MRIIVTVLSQYAVGIKSSCAFSSDIVARMELWKVGLLPLSLDLGKMYKDFYHLGEILDYRRYSHIIIA